MSFNTPIDVVGRALQQAKLRRIHSLTDASPNAQEMAFAYDKLRQAELQRNIWTFAVRRTVLRAIDINTYALIPAAWSATSVYVVGSVVAYQAGVYVARAGNTNVTPWGNPASWVPYFGPMVVSLWADPLDGSGVTISPPTSGYYSGEMVYTPQTGAYKVFMSLSNNNTDTPGVYPAWSATTVYNVGDTVTLQSGGMIFDPGGLSVVFDPGQLPILVGGGLFQSITDLNVGNNPQQSGANWVALPVPNQTDVRTGLNWLQLDATVQSINIIYPLGAGPVIDPSTRNIFQLPHGFLRPAPQSPKAGSRSVFGIPGSLPADDWEFNDNYVVSGTPGPIVFRFVADVADVSTMDNMFCEGLACRLAREVGAAIAAGNEKPMSAALRSELRGMYREVMAEARLVNAIEQGPVQPVLDDWLACRY